MIEKKDREKESKIRVVQREEVEEEVGFEDAVVDREDEIVNTTVNTQAIVNPAVTTVEPTKETVRITRDVVEEAKILAESKKLPTLPVPVGRLTDFETMSKWLDLLTEEQFKRIVIYVYRLYPKIDRKLSDPSNYKYINCISSKITFQDMVKNHGGGKYSFHLTDVEGANRHKELFQARLDINTLEYEPILDYRELDYSSRDNVSFIQGLRARNILDGDNKVMGGTVGGNSGSGSELDKLKEIIGFAKSLTNEQQQLVKEKAGINDSKPLADILIAKLNNDGKDNTNMMTMFGTMMSTMMQVMKDSNKPIIQSTNNDNGAQLMQFMQLMLTQIQSSTTSQMEMMKMMMQDKRGNNDPFEQIEKIFTLVDKVKGGGAAVESRDVVDKVMDGIERIGLPIFDNVLKMFALSKGATGLPVGNQNQAGKTIPGQAVAKQVTSGGNATSNIYKVGTQTRSLDMEMPPENNPKPNGAIMQNTNQNNQNTTINTNQSNNQMVNENEQSIQALSASLQGPQGAIVLQAMNTGKKGYEFAEWLVEGYGVQTWTLITQYGEENVVRAMMGIQQFAGFGQEFVQLWVNNFFHYEEALAMLEEDSDGDDPDNDDGEVTELPVVASSGVTNRVSKKNKKVVQ